MSTTITRLFDTYEHASAAVAELESSGIPHSAISIVANNESDRYSSLVPGSAHDAAGADPAGTAGSGAGIGASLGTVIGGGAGLLTGLGLLAIPGVGPVVAAGWLVATAVGAGLGAASGGLIGSLVGAGVSEADAHVLNEGVRRGGTLVTVRAEDHQMATVDQILGRHQPVDIAARGEHFRASGWTAGSDMSSVGSASMPVDARPTSTPIRATDGTTVI